MTTDLTARMSKALALSGNEYSFNDVARLIFEGHAQSWATDDAWIITRINDTPNVRSIHFWLAAGEKDACIELQKRILEWAKGIGCTMATMHGRKGWLRVLESEGWQRPDKLIVLEKRLG